MATPHAHTSKRHICFYDKEYTSVCSGINLKSQCSNPTCESVLRMGGLVIVKCPDLDTCVYQDVVYNRPCPACGTVLTPQQFSGVVFVRCEAEISVADKPELLRASQEETLLRQIEYLGPEIRISVLEREAVTPGATDVSQNYLIPTNGVNLAATCRHNDCLAFKNNQGLVVVRVGLIGSAVFQELVKFRNCPSCNHALDTDSFNAVTFLGCKADVVIGGKVETIDATSLPKRFKIEAAGPQAMIHVNRNPVIPSHAPVIPSHAPVIPSHAPVIPSHAPVISSHAPVIPSHAPVTPSLAPVIPSHAPVTPSHALAIPEKESSFGDFMLPDFDLRNVSVGKMQDEFASLLGKVPALKEAKLSDFGFNQFGLGDLTVGGLKKGLDNMMQGVPGLLGNTSSDMEPGINFMADCPNSDCGSVVIPSGHIVSCKFTEAIRGMTCPSCHQALPPNTFTGVAFLQCKASVRENGKESEFQAGQTAEIYEINPGEFEVEISVLERDAGAESSGQLGGKGESHVRVCPGLNIEAMCANPKCDASMVVIPCPGVEQCQYYDLITTLKCPACLTTIPPALFIGVSLVKCRAEVTIDSTPQAVEAVGDETKDINIELGGPPVSIKILKTDTSHSGQLSGGSGFEYASACSGLNIVAYCNNATCLAYKENDGQVNIKAPNVNNCLLRDAASNIVCPACATALDFSQVKAITFVHCSGEVIIGDRKETFKAAGDNSRHFLISPDGPEVVIKISSKTQERKDQTSSDRKYTKVCDGVNFVAFCENPACLSVREYDGYVNVKRDEQFVQRGGYPPNRCNYNVEVQDLNCPSCDGRLNPKIARGVALVRCRGTIEIAGKSQNFEATMNDFVKFDLDHSDPRTFVEYEVVNVLPHGQGLNVLFRCPNMSCPCQDHPLLKGIVFLKFGTVKDCKVNELILAENCHLCKNNIPMDNIVAVLFNDCTAVVRVKGNEKNYLTGSRVQTIPFEFSDDIEVDIFPVTARDVSLMHSGDNPFFSLTTGLNVQAVCSNQSCAANRLYEGKVCISCPQLKHSKLSELLSALNCSSCGTHELSPLSLSFLECKGYLQSSGKKYLIEAASEEVIDFESSFLNPDLSIQVLSLDEDFPESKERQIGKGSEYSHASVCHGLNFRASCTNPQCVSIKNHEYVNIMSGHLLDFDYRSAIQSLTCICCGSHIPPNEVEGVTMLCCKGEVRIGERIVKFDYSGDKISRIKIPNDGSNVWIRVEHRTYDVTTHPQIAYLYEPFKTVCKGLNFRCYCKNTLCTTFKEREGLVIVQRDTTFANTYGFAQNVCHYHEEISRLKCPDCSESIRRYFVWGVLFSSCSGTITRNGSPPEKFSTLIGKIVLYALDRDDTTVCIEFSEQ